MAFNGQRLRVIRNFNNHTQRDLASLVAVSAATISMYETGAVEPSAEVLDALCDVLGVRPQFFFGADLDEFAEVECNFRDTVSASARLRLRVLAHGTLFSYWIEHLRGRVRFPAANIPDYDVSNVEDIERAAEGCRLHWKLGLGPIRQVNRVLENAGIIITQLDAESTKIDAFSRYSDALNMVVLNTAKGSNSRAVFDCMHELGHGVLHRDPKAKPRETREDEANYFAGAFLLPRETFGREFFLSRINDWAYLVEMKKRWGVSLQSIIKRAQQLKLINTAEFRRWQRIFSAKGMRSGVPEPAEPDPITPELLTVAYEQYRSWTGKTASELAGELHLDLDTFARITGFTPSTLDKGTDVEPLAQISGDGVVLSDMLAARRARKAAQN